MSHFDVSNHAVSLGYDVLLAEFLLVFVNLKLLFQPHLSLRLLWLNIDFDYFILGAVGVEAGAEV